MSRFGKINPGEVREDDDVIVIHLGKVSDEQFQRVQESIIAFMNMRWPNIGKIGIDN